MERTFLRWLRTQLGDSASLPLGLLDDAAIIEGIDRDRCVVTSDLLAEGVHFELASGLAQIGRKALAVNLSDLAAMAAEPIAAFVSMILPASAAQEMAQSLYEGMFPLAREHSVAIGGGDTNVWHGPLVISVTAIGQAPQTGALTRQGAQPGDVILVTGPLGGSIDAHHLDFQPRVKEAAYLHSSYRLHAGMDISDGLLLDLDRMAEASGCAACLKLEAIPVSRAARELSCCVADPEAVALQRALSDGEDFELLLAIPGDDAQRIVADPHHGLTCTIIGEFFEGTGLWQFMAGNHRKQIEPRGYEHGRT